MQTKNNLLKSTLSLFSMVVPLALWAQKPILPDFHADPSAHQWDGKYWIYASTDEKGSTSWKEMKRWWLYSSTDLKDWSDEGEIFSLEEVSWASESAFAPDAIKRNGKYYLFFPAQVQIGVAVADKPSGPYKDILGEPLIKERECKGVASFDPTIFIDDDEAKTPYLYYGGGGGAAVVELDDNLTKRVSEIQKIALEGYGEGIWVHKYNGLYYFSYPSPYDDEDGNRKQLLVYSTAPTPTGPFTYRGSFLDNKSRNSHHSIIEIKDRWYLFYHIEGPSGYERRVCIDYLEYDKDGLIKPVKMTKKGVKALK
ncbi:MAG: family 43 glycosylhydrolase [Rikenellaceae bacterium]